MFKYLDAYTLRARLSPAIIAAAPAFAAVALLISWSTLSFSNSIAAAGLLVLLFALADLARRFGKGIEPQLYAEMGGKPTVTMLRHNGPLAFDAVSRARYREFLGNKINETPPTEGDEAVDPAAADAFYDRCAGWLRENTRNAKKFHVLFNENITYGFRRNLLGLKRPALALNVFVVATCLFLLNWGSIPFQDVEHISNRIFVVLVVAVLHALYLCFGVNKATVFEASRTYSRQLIYSCETFLGKKTPLVAKRKKSDRNSITASTQSP